MSRSVGRSVSRSPPVLGIPGAGVPPAQQAADWDVMTPRGKTRVIDFAVDEGTWMSVDLARDGQWLVFDLLGHIYRLPIAGGEAVNLTANSGIALNFHPRISPDGREIAFVSDRGGQDNLWVMNADGSAPRQIFRDDNSRAAEPAWAPDGQSILITRKVKSPAGFYRTNDEIWRFPRAGGEGNTGHQAGGLRVIGAGARGLLGGTGPAAMAVALAGRALRLLPLLTLLRRRPPASPHRAGLGPSGRPDRAQGPLSHLLRPHRVSRAAG